MRKEYQHGDPLVRILVKGRNGEMEYEAYLDTGARKTLIPETDATTLGLEYMGDTQVITGSGKDAIKLFWGKIIFLGKEFKKTIFGRDLPKQADVKAIAGRDLIDKFRICFDGSQNRMKVERS